MSRTQLMARNCRRATPLGSPVALERGRAPSMSFRKDESWDAATRSRVCGRGLLPSTGSQAGYTKWRAGLLMSRTSRLARPAEDARRGRPTWAPSMSAVSIVSRISGRPILAALAPSMSSTFRPSRRNAGGSTLGWSYAGRR